MSTSLLEWLTSNGFEKFQELDVDYATLEELAGVPSKKIRNLGGTDEDHARLVASVRQHLHSASAEQALSQAQAQSALLSRLPIFVADLHQQLLQETHPRVRLSRLFDVAEMVTRWVAAVLVSALHEPESGSLPADLARALRTEIERPSFGKWLGIVRSACKAMREPTLQGSAAGTGLGLIDRWSPSGAKSKNTWPEDLPKRLELVVRDRNHFIHGGGDTLAWCHKALDTHLPLLEKLLAELAQAMDGVDIVAVKGGAHFNLKGVSAVATPARPGATNDDGIWLHEAERALPLWPLMRHGSVSNVMGDAVSPGVYLSVGKKGDQLKLQPPAGAETGLLVVQDADFRRFFQLDETKVTETPAQRTLEAARREAEQLVGREAELQHLMTWLNAPAESEVARVGLLYGGPGLGKSTLMAGVITAVAAPDARPTDSPDRLHVHRFRRGDSGNSPHAFWQGLLEQLQAWGLKGDEEKMPEESASRPQQIRYWLSLLPAQSPARRLVCLIDGLDEVAAAHPTFPADLAGLALPGTTWLISSREEPAIVRAFTLGESAPGARVLPQGLQPLGAAGIREMLLAAMTAAVRCKLLGLDRDDAAGNSAPDNDFVRAVVDRAGGNPLYVRFLLDDLEQLAPGSPLDKGRLPHGLEDYYRKMLNNLGASDVARTLPPVVALLACAEEPLPPDSLRALIPHAPSAQVLDEALLLGGAMFRYAPTANGQEGLSLYHTNLREFILREDSPLRETVAEARRLLWQRAAVWAKEVNDGLRAHLFRQGNSYALAWGGSEGQAQVLGRLMDFPYLMARLARITTSNLNSLLGEYRHLRKDDAPPEFGVWEEFFRTHAHVLRRECADWPGHKILLQLAAEHADDSVITAAAERWLREGHCDWVWLRRKDRKQVYSPNRCLQVFEGHSGSVYGAEVLSDGRILSWSMDGTLRLWDGQSGATLMVLDGHSKCVGGAKVLTDGRILSWSRDGTLRLWDGHSGAELAVLHGHSEPVKGAKVLPDGRILSWSRDGTIRLWDDRSGASLAVLDGYGYSGPIGVEVLSDSRILLWSTNSSALHIWGGQGDSSLASLRGHSKRVLGTKLLPDGRILSWSADRTLRLWDGQNGASLAVLEGHSAGASGAEVLPDGRILSWSEDRTLRLWDGRSGASLALLQGHSEGVDGAEVLPDGRILSWSMDRTLRLWDGQSGASLSVLEGHSAAVHGAEVLPDGRFISWSRHDITLRLWGGNSDASSSVLAGHSEGVQGAKVLPDGRILSWSWDGTLRIWGGNSDASSSVPAGHSEGVQGAKVLPDGRILSWSWDGTLRIWGGSSDASSSVPAGHTGGVQGTKVLPDGRILSRSNGGSVRLWDGQSGELLSVLAGHSESVNGAEVLPGGRILSWSRDGTLRLWDGHSGTELAVLHGHSKPVKGAKVLPDGRILSWSWDGTLRIWNCQNGASLAVLEGHSKSVNGIELLSDGRMLSWSDDGTLRLWSGQSGALLAVLKGHRPRVSRPKVLPDGRILSWSAMDCNARLWDGQSGASLAVLEGHSSALKGAEVLPGGRILSWSWDSTLRFWNGQNGASLAVLEGHSEAVTGAKVLSDGRILSWSLDGTLRLWDGQTGASLAALEGHSKAVTGAEVLPHGRILSWSEDSSLRLWDCQSGECLDAMPERWLESASFPGRWREYVTRLGLRHRGKWSLQARDRRVSLAGSETGFRARWQANGGSRLVQSDTGLPCALVGEELVFLEAFRGGKRLDLEVPDEALA